MKFLCIEDGEEFILVAKDINEARGAAAIWGASVIRELTEGEE